MPKKREAEIKRILSASKEEVDRYYDLEDIEVRLFKLEKELGKFDREKATQLVNEKVAKIRRAQSDYLRKGDIEVNDLGRWLTRRLQNRKHYADIEAQKRLEAEAEARMQAKAEARMQARAQARDALIVKGTDEDRRKIVNSKISTLDQRSRAMVALMLDSMVQGKLITRSFRDKAINHGWSLDEVNAKLANGGK